MILSLLWILYQLVSILLVKICLVLLVLVFKGINILY